MGEKGATTIVKLPSGNVAYFIDPNKALVTLMQAYREQAIENPLQFEFIINLNTYSVFVNFDGDPYINENVVITTSCNKCGRFIDFCECSQLILSLVAYPN